MTRILALDSAATTGFALGAPGVEIPCFGTRNFNGRGASGEVVGRFRLWLCKTIETGRPTVICYEAPYFPMGFRNGPPANAKTLRRLLGLAEIIDAVGWEYRIACYQATAGEVCRYLTGKGSWGGRDAKKAATIAAALRYGWDCGRDDNQADALAVWAFAESIFDPVAAQQRRARLGLELQLHPGKGDAPRLLVAGRRGVGPNRRKGVSSDGKRAKNNSDTSEFQFAPG